MLQVDVVVGTRGGDVLGQHVQGVKHQSTVPRSTMISAGLQVAFAPNMPAALSPAEARQPPPFSGARGSLNGGRVRGRGCPSRLSGAEDSDAFASALSLRGYTRVSVTVGSVFFVGDRDAVEEGRVLRGG